MENKRKWIHEYLEMYMKLQNNKQYPKQEVQFKLNFVWIEYYN